MAEGVQALTEREKETLRLLLGGHDAKSIARSLDLSVHTVNERLRDARRKLAVSSSREAARLLDEVERDDPNLLVDKELGVALTPVDGEDRQHSDERRTGGRSLFWLSGGMLIMSLLIAAAVLSFAFFGNGGTESPQAPNGDRVETAPNAVQSPATVAAGAWVLLLDDQRWDESWNAAGALFKSQMPKARWASTIQPVRQPFGPMSSRTLQSATKASSLPGAPAGEYEIVVFKTDFAQKPGAIETVVLAREGDDWKVNGYFMR
ncbi:DUF4019 domain-containing protein [Sphingomonas sp. S1-29]|uniref:helix-turn-helix domain-containing protein n=1 Tax=Sphingomonas sp. S1-29 TaxID=2991074 RepID=UPI00223FD1A6|nr:DUF4019 domain-containing protein [Sphingomonas sp. S1-29]UZK68381.1 DUF4019 domain-containing protein [Sphingomonas sp. S1-29]